MEWCTSSFCSPRYLAHTALSVYEWSLYSRCTACSTSKMTRPSMVISFVSRTPICAEEKVDFFTRVRLLAIRPSRGKLSTLSLRARSIRYGMSKPTMLYPVMMSGSQATTKSRHARSISPSHWKLCTSAPEMGAQVLSVKMFLTRGAVSPCARKILLVTSADGDAHK